MERQTFEDFLKQFPEDFGEIEDDEDYFELPPKILKPPNPSDFQNKNLDLLDISECEECIYINTLFTKPLVDIKGNIRIFPEHQPLNISDYDTVIEAISFHTELFNNLTDFLKLFTRITLKEKDSMNIDVLYMLYKKYYEPAKKLSKSHFSDILKMSMNNYFVILFN